MAKFHDDAPDTTSLWMSKAMSVQCIGFWHKHLTSQNFLSLRIAVGEGYVHQSRVT